MCLHAIRGNYARNGLDIPLSISHALKTDGQSHTTELK